MGAPSNVTVTKYTSIDQLTTAINSASDPNSILGSILQWNGTFTVNAQNVGAAITSRLTTLINQSTSYAAVTAIIASVTTPQGILSFYVTSAQATEIIAAGNTKRATLPTNS